MLGTSQDKIIIIIISVKKKKVLFFIFSNCKMYVDNSQQIK